MFGSDPLTLQSSGIFKITNLLIKHSTFTNKSSVASFTSLSGVSLKKNIIYDTKFVWASRAFYLNIFMEVLDANFYSVNLTDSSGIYVVQEKIPESAFPFLMTPWSFSNILIEKTICSALNCLLRLLTPVND